MIEKDTLTTHETSHSRVSFGPSRGSEVTTLRERCLSKNPKDGGSQLGKCFSPKVTQSPVLVSSFLECYSGVL